MSDDTAASVLEHLTLAYGAPFTRQFGAAEPAAVQVAWGKELAGLTPQQIRRGLANLPVKPPSAVAFRALCVTRPPPQQGAQKPQGAPMTAPSDTTSLSMQLGRRGPQGPRQWAVDLQAREQQGDKLSRFQRRCWREGLGYSWEDCA
jgi:hypothetical protein